MALSFLNVLIGFFLSNWATVLTRDKISAKSPTKFNFVFWFKDNWIKALHSLVLSCGLNLAFQLNLSSLEELLGFTWYNIYGILLGFCPDLFLSIIKDKLRVLQPKNVKLKDKTYERK